MNAKGEKIAVVIGIKEYEALIEKLEDLEDLRDYNRAIASAETPIPLEEAIARIERSR